MRRYWAWLKREEAAQLRGRAPHWPVALVSLFVPTFALLLLIRLLLPGAGLDAALSVAASTALLVSLAVGAVAAVAGIRDSRRH